MRRRSVGAAPLDNGLLFLFVASFPFLSALSPAVWLPVPTIIAVFAAAIYAIEGRFWNSVFLERDDLFLIALFFLGLLPLSVNYSYAGVKNLNYTLWLLSTFSVLLIWVRGWLRIARPLPEDIGRAATVGLLLASLAVTTEFVTANIYGFYLADVIPYSADQMSSPYVLGLLARPRGLAAEPGFTAMVMECLAPLAWLYLRSRRLLFGVCAILIFPGFLLCFSAASWVCMSVALVIVLAFRGSIGRWGLWAAAILVVLAILVATVPDVQWVYDQIIGRKLDDLAGTSDTELDTAAGRATTYRAALAIALNYPFGIGWGMIAQLFDTGRHLPDVPALQSRGMLSLYLEVLVSGGLAGVVVLVVYLGKKIAKIARRRDPDATAVLFALITISLHHAAVLEFWYPMLWFLIALSGYLSDAKSVDAWELATPLSASAGQ